MLMKEAVLFRQTLAAIYQTKWRYNRENCNINNHGRSHFKSYSLYIPVPDKDAIFCDPAETVFHLDRSTN
jgi:hypothetical protein